MCLRFQFCTYHRVCVLKVAKIGFISHSVQVEPEHAQKGAAGVQVPVDVLAHHLPRVLEHVRPRHGASQPAALARRVSGQTQGGPSTTLAWPGWKQPEITVTVDTPRLETSRFPLLYYIKSNKMRWLGKETIIARQSGTVAIKGYLQY
jgi:hypothetical protein